MYSIIVLIIASHSEIYDSFLELWREKIRLGNLHFPDIFSHLRFFFVFSDPLLKEDIVCENDMITCKYPEGEPGIFFKTMDAFSYCEKHFTYDSILRTNLSSFWNFPVFYDSLLNHSVSIGSILVQLLFRNRLDLNIRWKSYFDLIDVFLPPMDTFYFLDGAGFLLSRDIIRKLLYPVSKTILMQLSTIPDDVAISILLFYISFTYFPKETFTLYELLSGKKIICKDVEFPEDYLSVPIGFIRNKVDECDRKIDILNYKQQIRYYYRKN